MPVPANTRAVREAHRCAPAQDAPGMPIAPGCALGPPAGCESGWEVCKSRGERATSGDWTCVTWTLWQTFPACPHARPLLHRVAHMSASFNASKAGCCEVLLRCQSQHIQGRAVKEVAEHRMCLMAVYMLVC